MVSANGTKPEILNFDGDMPDVVPVEANGQKYMLSTDVSPTLLQRAVRWLNAWNRSNNDVTIPTPDDGELTAIVAEALGIPVEEAGKFRFRARFKLADFLLALFNNPEAAMKFYASLSKSPSPTEAP
jgi:hypothetical protein